MEECCHYLKDVLGKLVDDPRLAGQGPAVSGARALGRGEPGSQGQAKNRQNNFHFCTPVDTLNFHFYPLFCFVDGYYYIAILHNDGVCIDQNDLVVELKEKDLMLMNDNI